MNIYGQRDIITRNRPHLEYEKVFLGQCKEANDWMLANCDLDDGCGFKFRGV